MSSSQSKSWFFPLKCLSFSIHLLSWIHTRCISLVHSSVTPQSTPPHHLLPMLLTYPRIPSVLHLLPPHRNMFYPSCFWVGCWCLLTVANGEFGESAALVRYNFWLYIKQNTTQIYIIVQKIHLKKYNLKGWTCSLYLPGGCVLSVTCTKSMRPSLNCYYIGGFELNWRNLGGTGSIWQKKGDSCRFCF